MFLENLLHGFNFWVYVILLMIGLFAMITKNNLVKKLIGMSIFQTAIILFFVSLGVSGTIEDGTTIPIIDHSGDHHGAETHATEHDGETKDGAHPKLIGYVNPLPHVLMLTAIVVGVATLGVALAITQVIFRDYETLEENEILEKIRTSDG